MSKEKFIELTGTEFLDLWINRSDKDTNEARKKEMKSIRTTLSATDIKKLFPEPTNTCPHYAPYIATPTMLRNFIQQWSPELENKSDFSLMPLLQRLNGELRSVQGEPHIDYADLRGFYRFLMIQNLIYSGWRAEKDDTESKFSQAERDRDFKGRLKRLVESTGSHSWSFFSNGGDEIWKVAQAEVLAYMEKTEFPVWTNIFHRTQRDLRNK